jgi:hypothetical protein
MKQIVLAFVLGLFLQGCSSSESLLFETPQPGNEGEVLTEFPNELRGEWNKINIKEFDTLNALRAQVVFNKKGKLKTNDVVKQDKNGQIRISMSKDEKDDLKFKDKNELIKFLELFDRNKNLISITDKNINISFLMNSFIMERFLGNTKDQLTYSLGNDLLLKKWNDKYFINRKVFPFFNDSCVSFNERNKPYWETYILSKIVKSIYKKINIIHNYKNLKIKFYKIPE